VRDRQDVAVSTVKAERPGADQLIVSEHPVQLHITDDLQRSRLTVFFRALLSIPHWIWLALWSIAALLVAIVNWFATLALARAPSPLHRFLAAYVKYVTQFYAYLHLAADPYPPFDGQAGYPVDVTIAPPTRQNRASVLFRIVLLWPAAVLAAVFVGNPTSGFNSGRGAFSLGFGLLSLIALLGWFAIMARHEMPRGLRDCAAYTLCYGAQLWAYALLLTDRYPDSDPIAALPDVPVRADPIHLELDDELRRSRLTVFFRLPLSFPHLVWLTLWGVLAWLGAIVNWLLTLLLGRSPAWLHHFLAAYLRYQFHVYAFLYVIANPFPGFVGRAGSYPFEIAIAERERQNRWKTGFRAILSIPALLLASAFSVIAQLIAVLGWFSSFARARTPRGLRNAGAFALRYQAQTLGYLLLLTDAYPYSGPARSGPAPSAEPHAPAPSAELGG
jgi:hypothetical protein